MNERSKTFVGAGPANDSRLQPMVAHFFPCEAGIAHQRSRHRVARRRRHQRPHSEMYLTVCYRVRIQLHESQVCLRNQRTPRPELTRASVGIFPFPLISTTERPKVT